MPDNFNDAIEKSVTNFELCKPVLKDLLGWDFISIENTDNEHDKQLDMKAGIDVFAYCDKYIRGVASRIQIGHPYNTFTIRFERQSGAETEYEKRIYAFENDVLYPHFTFQAYVDNGELQSLAICHTKDLFQKILDGHKSQRSTGNDQIGQASFYVVDWDCFAPDEIKIFIKK